MAKGSVRRDVVRGLSTVLVVTVLVLAAVPSLDAQKSKKSEITVPRARISVADIKDQTAQGGISTHWMERFRITWREIGGGMREMLITALFQTRRFVLLERDLPRGGSSARTSSSPGR